MQSLLLSLIMLLIALPAKTGEIDSLLNILASSTDKSEKAELLNDLCLKLVYSNPDSALIFGNMALDIGKSDRNNTITGKAFNRIGIVYDVKNLWDSALMFYDSARFYAESVSDSITIASACNNTGLVYWNQSQYDKAIENFIFSLKIFERLGKKRGMANTYNNIGLILMEQNRDSAAFYYQFNGLRIREEIGDKEGMNDSRLNIALLFYSTGQYDSSSVYYRKVIPFYLQTVNHYALGTAFHGLAQVFEARKEWDSSLYYFDKAIDCHLKVQNFYKAASSLLNKSFVFEHIGDNANELKELLKAYDLIKDENSPRVKSKILFQLADLYNRTGQYKKAAELFLEFKILRDSLYSIDRDEKIEQIKVQYETEKREKALLEQKAENERLEKEKALAEVRVNNRNNLLITLSGAGMIFIFFLLYLSQRAKRKAQAEKDAAIILERESGMKAIFDAQEEERQRIAKDLHDGIGQQVSALKLMFQSLTKGIIELKPDMKGGLDKIHNLITETGSDVRTISHQMMPRSLTELGLVEALEDMIGKSFPKDEIICNFEHYRMEERLPQHVEIGLYRIAQELLNNIIKHSGAKKVDIQLMRIDTHCVLVVQDDGKGLSSNKGGQGIGMMNISNRLRTMNGELNMESSGDHGTTATIRIALE